MAQWRRPPTPDEMRRLVESKVREEILYREALALGLDQGDTIVKRRMVQKMEFLAEDVSALREPNREELKDWFEKNATALHDCRPGVVSPPLLLVRQAGRAGTRGRRRCAREARRPVGGFA